MKQKNKLMAAFIATVIMVSSAMAQAPQKMSYQSVIRNANGALVANQAVGVKISLLQGSATGTAVYVETQNLTTNANGLASFQIGAGTVVSGSFASINWAAGPYFVKTETDPTGGSNYSIAGTSQLLSVAYALYAANSGTQGAKGDSGVSIRNTKVNGDSLFVTLSNGQSLNAGNVRGLTGATGGYPVHYIGENYGGGIVFFVYDGGQHGLIAATADCPTLYNATAIYTNGSSDGLLAGINNTVNMGRPGAGGTLEYVVKDACNSYYSISGGIRYSGWYLPSKYELDLLFQQKNSVGSFNPTYDYPSSTSTTTSTGNAASVWFQNFSNGNQSSTNNYVTFFIRLIRAF